MTRTSLHEESYHAAGSQDPFAGLLGGTSPAGTWVSDSLSGMAFREGAEPIEYVSVRLDVIFEYERTIHRLRQELLHYRSLLWDLLPKPGGLEEQPYPEPVVLMDASSVRLLNSILAARIPPSATFRDFDEGEL